MGRLAAADPACARMPRTRMPRTRMPRSRVTLRHEPAYLPIPRPHRSDGQALLVCEELLLRLEQQLVRLEQLLGAHPHLVGEPLAFACLVLEHLLVLDLDDGLV